MDCLQRKIKQFMNKRLKNYTFPEAKKKTVENKLRKHFNKCLQYIEYINILTGYLIIRL